MHCINRYAGSNVILSYFPTELDSGNQATPQEHNKSTTSSEITTTLTRDPVLTTPKRAPKPTESTTPNPNRRNQRDSLATRRETERMRIQSGDRFHHSPREAGRRRGRGSGAAGRAATGPRPRPPSSRAGRAFPNRRGDEGLENPRD